MGGWQDFTAPTQLPWCRSGRAAAAARAQQGAASTPHPSPMMDAASLRHLFPHVLASPAPCPAAKSSSQAVREQPQPGRCPYPIPSPPHLLARRTPGFLAQTLPSAPSPSGSRPRGSEEGDDGLRAQQPPPSLPPSLRLFPGSSPEPQAHRASHPLAVPRGPRAHPVPLATARPQ